MTPLEIIALTIIVLVLVKLVVVLTNPKAWLRFARSVYSNTAAASLVALVLAAVVLYYLLAELTIVQVFAAFAFLSLLMVVSVAPQAEELMRIAQKRFLRKNLVQTYWLSIIIWVVLSVWALWAVLAK